MIRAHTLLPEVECTAEEGFQDIPPVAVAKGGKPHLLLRTKVIRSLKNHRPTRAIHLTQLGKRKDATPQIDQYGKLSFRKQFVHLQEPIHRYIPTAIIHTKLIQKGTPLQLNKLNLLTLVKQKPTHIPTGFGENMTTPLAEICPPDPPTVPPPSHPQPLHTNLLPNRHAAVAGQHHRTFIAAS